MSYYYQIPVRCTVPVHDGVQGVCGVFYDEHVHQPLPCRNGYDERHHDFTPPKTVGVVIAGHRRRIKVPA